ncbi:MAG TPA: RNA-binding S4 domain-containing protein [Acholeplasmataceae bacterium]|jgi:ribosomal 50S subunit-recycling heat shock protein|nr:RNA-binding S4 domain-containing protein [Acholeplasmataceae bacterium]
MRLDKYLKVSRIIKRRTVASEAAKENKVYVNGKLAKPATMLKIGDIITINYFQKQVSIKVLSFTTSTKKEDASKMYEIINIQKNEAVE